MPKPQNQHLHDAATLTRALENVFRRLIRFLVGRISLVKLQEMIRNVYIEESESKLRRERPNKDVALTQLALLTGLDTRTLARIRNSDQYRTPLHEKTRFIKAMTPESCVLDVWTSNTQYLDSSSGKPKILTLHGYDVSFEHLVKEAVSSRGVTAQSILARLVRNRAVRFDESTQSVQLLEKIQAPYKGGNHWGVFEVGMLQVCSLLDTILYNFQATKNGDSTLYDRGSWTHRLSPKRRFEFQAKMKKFLKKLDDLARIEIENFEEETSSEDQLTAGVFIYYFEEGAKED